MSKRYPDLEIYIHRTETDHVLRWLAEIFELKQSRPLKDSIICNLVGVTGKEMECVILSKAARGGYTSVWFKSNETKWDTDKDCAVDAFDFFAKEIRCSAGGWQGEDEGGWFRVTDEGVKTANWLA
ncbi:MAG: hypothetical protein ABGY96_10030 [bacterium]|nr:hypothetical protein [Gammaproteobacteria bacterium]HIL98555.1 hypothetical protein [Pseudomonadales bacterium]